MLSQNEIDSGQARVFAPDGFLEAIGGENVLAGSPMSRRAQFQFGGLLKKGPRGQVDAGLGKVTARGTVSLLAPTDVIVEPVERHVCDGVEIDFHMAPGTEAPAEMHMFFPELGVLNMAENATPLLHNFCPRRVRSPRSAHLVTLPGGRCGTVWRSEPKYWSASTIGRHGAARRSIDFLERQRDLYKYIHDQTVRLMNHGWRPAEIAEALDIPPSLQKTGAWGLLRHRQPQFEGGLPALPELVRWQSANLNPCHQ